MTGSLISWVHRAWSRRGMSGKLLWLGLLPGALVFRGVVWLRNGLFDVGWLKSSRLSRPVVSIGNLTVGGTGKTPSALWLAEKLGDLGHRVAILSRGYGVREQEGDTAWLDLERAKNLLDARDGGSVPCADEPLMMSALYGHTVGVGPQRYASALRLLEYDATLGMFLLDDGFQHRQLAREVDVVLLGSDCQGSMLPAGPFREPVRALERADVILVTAAHDQWKRRLAGYDDPSKVFFGQLEPKGIVTRVPGGWREMPLSAISGAKVLAVSAIANPEPFYRMLQDWEVEIVDTLEFRDHHSYTNEDWHEISRRGHRVEKIMTTEKDLVKLVRYPFAAESLFALRVEMVVENEAALLNRISGSLFSNASQGAD